MKKQTRILAGVLGGFAVFAAGMMTFFQPIADQEQEEIQLKSTVNKLNQISDQETIEVKKRLTNDQLSELTPTELLSKYTKDAQTKLNKLFEGQEKARDYALTLIGKVIPATSLKTQDGNTITINKQTIIVILNTKEKSKNFVQILNSVKKENGIQYLAIFPGDNKDTVQKFLDENKLDRSIWSVANLEDNPKNNSQPDLLGIAEYYFNAKGAPSYLSLENNSIVFAANGNNKDLWNIFIENSFKKPYFYNLIAN